MKYKIHYEVRSSDDLDYLEQDVFLMNAIFGQLLLFAASHTAFREASVESEFSMHWHIDADSRSRALIAVELVGCVMV